MLPLLLLLARSWSRLGSCTASEAELTQALGLGTTVFSWRLNRSSLLRSSIVQCCRLLRGQVITCRHN